MTCQRVRGAAILVLVIVALPAGPRADWPSRPCARRGSSP